MTEVRVESSAASDVVRPPLILLVAYRADAHLEQGLTWLGMGPRVTVVDNDASEETRIVVANAGAQYVRARTNVGFAAAVNLGLSASWDGTSDVMLLNPDARVSATDVVRLQGALHAISRRAAVSPRLVDWHGRAQRAEWPLPSPGQVWLDAIGLGRFWRGPSFVIGAVLLLRAEALSELGWLDERYFLYAEEADWQLRAQRANWSVAVVDAVTAVHAGGASSSDPRLRERLFHASFETFALRWYGRPGWMIMRAGSILAACRRSVFSSRDARREGRRTLRIYLRGPLETAPARTILGSE